MRLFILSLIAVLAMFQYDFWFGNNGYLDYQETSAEIERQKIENAKLSQRNQTIAAEIKDLKESAVVCNRINRSNISPLMEKPF